MILDRKSFEHIYYLYGQRLINFACNFLPGKHAAEDLVHDSFIKLWDRYHGKDMSSWAPLIFTIVRNSCLDHQRHASMENNLFKSRLENTEDSERLFSLLMLGDVSDQVTIYRQLETELHQIIEKLPARCREIFLLSRYEGMSNKDIAIRLGISEQAVKNQVSKAMKVLKQSLVGDGYVDNKLFSSVIFLLLP